MFKSDRVPALRGKNWGPNPNQELIAIDTSCKGIISYLPWIATGQTPYPMVIGQPKINPVVFVHLLLFGLFLSYWSFVFCGGVSVLFLLCGFFFFKKNRAKEHEVGWEGIGEWKDNQNI